MGKKQLSGRSIVVALFCVQFVVLLSLAAYFLFDINCGWGNIEVLPSNEALPRLNAILGQYWRIGVNRSVDAVNGQVDHPSLAPGRVDWFSIKTPQAEAIVQSLISDAKQHSRLQKVEDVWPGTLDPRNSENVNGWWKSNSRPDDLKVFSLYNGNALWLGYSKQLGMVYIQILEP